jgi:hypothetical protein
MGVTGRSITSLGIGLTAASLALLAVMQAGCAGEPKRAAAVPASTTSVDVAAPAVRPPARPRPYALPAGAVRVSSSAELAAALSNGRREAIVLAPGVYDSARPFSDRDGDRLFAERLGRAILKTGVVLGANEGPPGASIRGLTFNVTNPAKTLHGSIVHVWGSATHASVLDTRLYGHGRIDSGLLVRQPLAFVARRIVAEGFRSYGVAVDPNTFGYRTRAPFSLSDLTISRVHRPVSGSSNGRAEACLWLGSPGTARRVSVRRCGVTGIWTGTATSGSRVADATVDRAPVGIYLEHFTSGTTFQRLRIGPDVDRGVNAEWSNVAVGQKPATSDNVIQDCYFRTRHVGVYLDEGTTHTVVRRCLFAGQSWAAIGDYLGRSNSYYGNDFNALGPAAVPVSHDHDPEGSGGGG